MLKMSKMKVENSSKHQRKIKGPYKKWSTTEEQELLLFLKENQPFEKPTAQVFYRRFLALSGIKSDWHILRAKVRNMRQGFQKLKKWENSEGAETLFEGETIRDAILNKCPLYCQMEDIFGHIESTIGNAALHSEVSVQSDQFNSENLYSSLVIDSEKQTDSDENNVENGEYNIDQIPASNGKGDIYSRSAPSNTMQVQSMLTEIKKEKIYKEKLKERELELQYEKFLFEKEAHLREIEMKQKEFEFKEKEIKLKEKEIESNEKVKIMEILVKEKIALKEIEMKERIELEKLKRGN